VDRFLFCYYLVLWLVVIWLFLFLADIDGTSSNSSDMNNIVERSTNGAIGPNDIVTNIIAQQIIGKLINKQNY